MFIPGHDFNIEKSRSFIVVWNTSTGEVYMGAVLGWVQSDDPTVWNPVVLNAATGQGLTVETTKDDVDTKYTDDFEVAARMVDDLRSDR